MRENGSAGRIDALVQFLAGLEGLRGREDISAAFAYLLRDCGFAYYYLLRAQTPVSSPLDLVLAGCWPKEWGETYLARHYFQIDPTMRYLGQVQTGFHWRDALTVLRNGPDRIRMERMMADAHRHGLEDGYSFPVHGRRGLIGSLSIAGKPRDLGALEMTLFDTVAKRVFWKMLQAVYPEEAARRADGTDIQLTRREGEALRLLAEGLTSQDIAQMLGITSHTVDWYMNGIQRKLGARNRHHAIALAFRLGLVS